MAKRRQLIKRIDRDMRGVEREAERETTRIGRQLRIESLRAYRAGGNVTSIIEQYVEPFSDVLAATMTTGHLTGRLRAVRIANDKMQTKRFGVFDQALEALKRRLSLSDADVEETRGIYAPEAARVTRGMADHVEHRVQQTVVDLQQRGAHVREGVVELRQAFDNVGVTAQKPYLLENIIRTQTALAYSAGRTNANRDPVIDEILWGYEYVATMDDRTRPNHAALDGTKLPKNDPRWAEITPPNGFSCRCTRLEIWRDDEDTNATDIDPIGRPDEGWAFDPAEIGKDSLPLPSA